MKKLLLILSLFAFKANAQTQTKKVGKTNMLCIDDVRTKTSYIYMAGYSINNEYSKENSFRNISLEDAFPEHEYDSTCDGIIFVIKRDYYSVYLRSTSTKYTKYRTTKEDIFLNSFIKRIEDIRKFNEHEKELQRMSLESEKQSQR